MTDIQYPFAMDDGEVVYIDQVERGDMTGSRAICASARPSLIST